MGTEKKLYVGNIPFRSTEEDIEKLFSQAGQVISVNFIRDNATGRMRGFGFVEMASAEEGEKAISLFNGKPFMERDLVVSEARPQERRERTGYGKRDNPGGMRNR